MDFNFSITGIDLLQHLLIQNEYSIAIFKSSSSPLSYKKPMHRPLILSSCYNLKLKPRVLNTHDRDYPILKY